MYKYKSAVINRIHFLIHENNSDNRTHQFVCIVYGKELSVYSSSFYWNPRRIVSIIKQGHGRRVMITFNYHVTVVYMRFQKYVIGNYIILYIFKLFSHNSIRISTVIYMLVSGIRQFYTLLKM